MSELTTDEIIARGERAKFLLENPVFAEAVEMCELLCQARWQATAPDDAGSREISYHQFKAISSIEDMLNNFVTRGKNTETEEGLKNGNE